MNIGYIYKITCLANNRVYVGSKLSEIFIESYWSSSKNSEYWDDLKKYGKENFKREILCWCKTKDELRKKENEFILSENALVSNGGYNQASGAGMIIFSEEVKNKMRIAAKNRWESMSKEQKLSFANKKREQALDPNGKMQSKEYKEHMSKVCSGFHTYTNGKIDIKTKEPCPEGFYLGISNPNRHISRSHTKETKQKFSEQRAGLYINKHWWNNGVEQRFCEKCPGEEWHKGRLNPHWNKRQIFKHKCYCIEKNLVFSSIKEAAIWLNLENIRLETIRCNISRCCNGNKDEAYGYHWKYID